MLPTRQGHVATRFTYLFDHSYLQQKENGDN